MRPLAVIILLALVVLPVRGVSAVEDQNEALSGVAHLFLDDPEMPTFGRQFLEVKRLDFSLQSLRYVDDYLESVRKASDFESNRNLVILRAGAYVGEVIRLNSKHTHWKWLDYEAARTVDPRAFAKFGRVPATAAVLYDGRAFTFPLAKVEERLVNGGGDSVLFYAQVILSQSKVSD